MIRQDVRLAFLLVGGPVLAAPRDDHFETKMRPLLAQKCFQCHSDQAEKSKRG